MANVTCPYCKHVAVFDDLQQGFEAVGCTYDCECGRLLVIEMKSDDLVAVDLHRHMAQHLKEQFNIDTTPSDWGVIEVVDEREPNDQV
jgi:hypothetical protein